MRAASVATAAALPTAIAICGLFGKSEIENMKPHRVLCAIRPEIGAKNI